MEKEKKELDVPKIVLYILELIVLILAISFIYFSTHSKDYSGIYSEYAQKETVESLVIALKLYNVHEIPYLGITPKMQIYVKEDAYFVDAYYLEVVKGNIIIKNGETDEKDIIIRTTKEEMLKIINNSSYMKESLNSGRTVVEKVASDFLLFTKGYPDIFIKK